MPRNEDTGLLALLIDKVQEVAGAPPDWRYKATFALEADEYYEINPADHPDRMTGSIPDW